MLSILCAVIIGALAGGCVGADLQSTGWGITCGIFGFILTQLVIGLILRKKVNAVQQSLQQIMTEAHAKINRQLTMFQQRQPGNVNGLKQLADKFQKEAARTMLEKTDDFTVFYKWSPMLKKQINSMKMQLHFQLHDFAEVDRLLPQCMLVDPLSKAIKMVRMFKNEDKGLDRYYASKCAKVKADEGAYLACVYAWIKLHQHDKAAAMAALSAARKLSDHATLIDNMDKLANGREKNFSNAGFGDQWYALGLEEIKVQTMRRRGGMGY